MMLSYNESLKGEKNALSLHFSSMGRKYGVISY